jgi:hypothetical protein
MDSLFPVITQSDWPGLLHQARQRRQGSKGRISLAKLKYYNTQIMTPEKQEALKEMLQKLTKRPPAISKPGFSAYDYSGGNFDDAYSLGSEDGEKILAADILAQFFNDSTPTP